MRANIRSISGAVLMLIIIPLLAGLLACMPVPIGDPERSRIDTSMSGWWVMEDADSEFTFCLLRPYDKRTWLVILVSLETGDTAEIEVPEFSSPGEMFAFLQESEVGHPGIVGGEPAVYKTWMTRLGGERFMTWENIADIDDVETFLPEFWIVFKVGAQKDNYFELAMLNAEYDVFDTLADELEDGTDPWKARKHWERVIRKHVDDPELYAESPLRFHRVPAELAPKVSRLVMWSFDD
jgi:hypothetical protein